MVNATSSVASESMYREMKGGAWDTNGDESSFLDFESIAYGMRSFTNTYRWSQESRNPDDDGEAGEEFDNALETRDAYEIETELREPVGDERSQKLGPRRLIRSMFSRKQKEVKMAESDEDIVVAEPTSKRSSETLDASRRSTNNRSRSVPVDRSGVSDRAQKERSLDVRAPLGVARSMFRGLTKKAQSLSQERSLGVSHEKREEAVKLQLLMKENEEKEQGELDLTPMHSNKVTQRTHHDGDASEKREKLQRKKSKKTAEISPECRNYDKYAHREEIQTEKIGLDRYQQEPLGNQSSFLDSLYEAVGTWNIRDHKESMADYEKARLGDDAIAPRRVHTTRRLEIAPEPNEIGPVAPDVEDWDISIGPPASFEQNISDEKSTDNSVLETSFKADLSVVDSVMEAWEEIVTTAEIIARHYEVGSPTRSHSERRQENIQFRKALRMFRGHAKRLNIDETELFAAVREDPTILNESPTSDDDDEDDDDSINLGDILDDGLDRYVEAFEGMFAGGMRCGGPPLGATNSIGV